MTIINTLEIELAAVTDYLDGGDSIREIAKKYEIGCISDYSQ
jgi:transposase-like protein